MPAASIGVPTITQNILPKRDSGQVAQKSEQRILHRIECARGKQQSADGDEIEAHDVGVELRHMHIDGQCRHCQRNGGQAVGKQAPVETRVAGIAETAGGDRLFLRERVAPESQQLRRAKQFQTQLGRARFLRHPDVEKRLCEFWIRHGSDEFFAIIKPRFFAGHDTPTRVSPGLMSGNIFAISSPQRLIWFRRERPARASRLRCAQRYPCP